MVIIALTGPSNTGKTATINVACALMCADAKVIEKRESVRDDGKDLSCLLEYKGKKVAFYTIGEERAHLLEVFGSYQDKTCDIMVCAINTDGNLHGEVKRAVRKKYRFEVIATTKDRNVTEKHLLDACRIVNAIKRHTN